MIDEELLEHLEENACLLADGYESALIGITEGSNPVAVYDVDLCIKCLVDEGMITEDALDHFYYNTVGSYVGEKTPLFLRIFK
jgi:hypothetical protein|tara:strand:+ start:8696 stop:8944 length:249 start_codon:yes stop_codon:yes gene_type:complete